MTRTGWILALLGGTVAIVGGAIAIDYYEKDKGTSATLTPGTMGPFTIGSNGTLTLNAPSGGSISSATANTGTTSFTVNYTNTAVTVTNSGGATGTGTVVVNWTDSSGTSQSSTAQLTN
jgi:hypothetical protein